MIYETEGTLWMTEVCARDFVVIKILATLLLFLAGRSVKGTDPDYVARPGRENVYH